jgi:hypothetical protein
MWVYIDTIDIPENGILQWMVQGIFHFEVRLESDDDFGPFNSHLDADSLNFVATYHDVVITQILKIYHMGYADFLELELDLFLTEQTLLLSLSFFLFLMFSPSVVRRFCSHIFHLYLGQITLDQFL